MIRLAAVLSFIPAAAFADAGPAGHAHPHGLEGLALAALAIAGVLIARRMMR